MGGATFVTVGSRFFSACLAFALALPLVAATAASDAPIVVIYPITSTGGIDRDAGGNLALLIATKLTELGGVAVKPSIPGTTRPQFLENAVAVGADYYVTGFLTPIGTDSSLITQVVSTHSGSVVFSTTSVVKTYSDAVAQVDTIRVAILRHAGRGLAALDAPPPAPSASPASVANGGAVDIGRALRKRRRGKDAVPAASPTPPEIAARPTPAPVNERLLFALAGNLDPAQTVTATRAIVDGLARVRRPVAVLGVALGDNLKHAAAICAGNAGTHELDAATFLVSAGDTDAARIQLDLAAYDCAGKLVASSRANAVARGRHGLDEAFTKAATDAAHDLAAKR